ncbi:MAG: hypothetical protein K2H45_06705 [Acetatifactor sp.]|nr:hypothetical protein [Acetatifactor sp.]
MSDMEQENAALQDFEQIKYGNYGKAAFFSICMKALSEYLEEDREVLQQAVSALGKWMERFYAKGILTYDTWHDKLLEDSYFTDTVNGELLSRLLLQKDTIRHLIDDRNQEAKYLLELADRQKKRDNLQPKLLEQAARHFQKAGAYAEEIRYLAGEWPDMDAMLKHLADRKVREELAKLILYVKAEDEAALQCLKEYLQ